jgi:hypothetical protein
MDEFGEVGELIDFNIAGTTRMRSISTSLSLGAAR